MKVIKFIKEYWTQIVFMIWLFTILYKMYKNQIEATKCSLRNDILNIYDYCKQKKQITLYQKQAVHYSEDLYTKKGGNSFVQEIVREMDTWEVIE